MRYLKQIAHGFFSSLWIFFITFGSIMDVIQIKSNSIICNSNVDTGLSLNYNTSSSLYRYNDRCLTENQHIITYKVLNVIGGTLAISQFSYFLVAMLYSYLLTIQMTNFIFLFRTKFKMMVFIPLTIGFSYFYQYSVYDLMFCGLNADFCKEKPDHYDTYIHVYRSLLVVATILFVLHFVFITLFLVVFFMKRFSTWRHIQEKENALLITLKMKEAFETHALQRTFNLKDYLTYWSGKSDKQIIDEIPLKTRKVMNEFNVSMDQDGDKKITHNEFCNFTRKHMIGDETELWNILTQNCKYEHIDIDSIQDVLYELFFDRKQLALFIIGDHMILSYVMQYMAFILYSGSCIIITKIFGYDNAFGTGIDLFKTYTIILAYFLSNIKDNIRFVTTMIFDRPFDLGDVLNYNGNTYTVTNFNTNSTTLVGPLYLRVTNQNLLESSVENLTKSNVHDHFDITIPLNSSFNEQTIFRAMFNYSEKFKRDIIQKSIRISWKEITSSGKTIRCNWTYNFRILDRSRYVSTKTRILNFLYENCNENIIRSTYTNLVASGGGLNENEQILIQAHQEINSYSDVI